jgi:hypothetical protein
MKAHYMEEELQANIKIDGDRKRCMLRGGYKKLDRMF